MCSLSKLYLDEAYRYNWPISPFFPSKNRYDATNWLFLIERSQESFGDSTLKEKD
jgi:hypothetical protein